MNRNTGRIVLADSNFWIGFCDPRDQHHQRACDIKSRMAGVSFLIPWPVLYEVVSTRLVKRDANARRMKLVLDDTSVALRLDDAPFRERALTNSLALATHRKRHISLVDMVLRLLIESRSPPLSAFITFNKPDFVESCGRASLRIISKPAEMAPIR